MYVYRFLNKDGEIIYIGKATHLSERLKNMTTYQRSAILKNSM
jgi:excinuclease UvrABC nuclease subunit